MTNEEKQIEEMANITRVWCEIDNSCGSCHWETCNECLAECLYKAGYRKASEMVEVVRCKDCKYWNPKNKGLCEHGFGLTYGKENSYCSYGKRSECVSEMQKEETERLRNHHECPECKHFVGCEPSTLGICDQFEKDGEE